MQRMIAMDKEAKLGCELCYTVGGYGSVWVGHVSTYGKSPTVVEPDKVFHFCAHPRWWTFWAPRNMIEACRDGLLHYKALVRQWKLNQRAAAAMQDLAEEVVRDFAEDVE